MKKLFTAFLFFFLAYFVNAQTYSAGDITALENIYKISNGPKWGIKWPYDATTGKLIVPADLTTPNPFTGTTWNALGFLTSINLGSANMDGKMPDGLVIPTGLQAFTQLTSADFSNNDLTGYIDPVFLSFLPKLTSLNVSGTTITGDIPDAIGTLSTLTSLNASSTKVSKIPAGIGNLSNLVTLDLSGNTLTTIPVEIYKLNKLTSLNLSNNQIASIPVPGTTKSTATLTINITGNKLDFCQFENLKAGFPSATITANPQIAQPYTAPLALSGEAGKSIDFTVNVCGTKNVYKWQLKNGTVYGDISGATAAKYTITSLKDADAGDYRCVVTNPDAPGIIVNKDFTLKVEADWAPDFSITGVVEDTPKQIYFTDILKGAQLDIFKNAASKFISGTSSNEEIVFTNPTHGTISGISVTGFTYTPEANYFGTDQIVYTRRHKTDPNISNSGTITITIDPVNDKPTIQLTNLDGTPLSTLNVDFGKTVQFKAIMSDVTDKTLASSLTLEVVTGKIDYNATTQIATYSPLTNKTGFEFVVLKAVEISSVANNNGAPLSSDLQTAAFQVTKYVKPNEAPVANNFSIDVTYGNSVSFPIPASDDLTKISKLKFVVTSEPTKGTIKVSSNNSGELIYESNGGVLGNDSFKFKVTDEGDLTSNEATVTLNVSKLILSDIQGVSNVKSISPYSSTPYNLPIDEVNLFRNARLELFPSPKCKIDYSQKGKSYEFFVPYSLNSSYYRLYREKFAKQINSAISTSYITIKYIMNGTNSILAERKVYLTQYYQGVLPKSATIADSPIVSQQDTVTVSFGSSTSIDFTAYEIAGQLQMQITGQPTKGTLTNFAFVSYTDELATSYSGIYTPTENKESWDLIKYTISDALNNSVVETKVVHVLAKKIAPQIAVIADQTMNEDQVKDIPIQITDGDNTLAQLTTTVINSSDVTGFVYSIAGGVLKITPAANFNGSTYVDVTVIDPDNQSANIRFNLTVLPVNDLPVINIDTNFELLSNTQFSKNIVATDVDVNDNVTITMTKLPAWLSYNALTPSLGTLSGKPADSDAGTATITFTANDGTASVTKTVTIKVIGPKIDNPPVVANPVAAINLPKGSAPKVVDLSKVFTDADGDPITISVIENSNSKWLSTSLVGTNLTLTIADKAFTGFANITIEGKSKELTARTPVYVTTDDKAPIILKSMDNVTAKKNQAPLSIPLTGIVSDPDGDVLTYAVLSNSNAAMVTPSFTGNNLVLTFIAGQSGSADILFTASAYGLSVQSGLTVTINDAAPDINIALLPQTIVKNKTTTIDVSKVFIDSDDPTVAVSIAKITDATLLTGSVSGNNLLLTPVANKLGTTTVTLRGTTNGKTVDFTFSVLVINQQPVVNATVPNVDVKKNSLSVNFDMTPYFSDPDGDALTFKVKSNSSPDLITTKIISGKFLVLTFTADKIGSGTVEISASDSNLDVTTSFNVTVTPSTGISFDITTDNLLNIWPNPAKERVFMRNNSAQKLDNVNIQLIDLAGKVIISKKQAGFESGEVYELNIDQLQNGAYMLRIKSDQSETMKKLIVR